MEKPLTSEEWEQQKVLGNGSFGIVTLWRNKNSDERLAVKMCKFHSLSNLSTRQRDRWTMEVETMKKINHKNVVCSRELPNELKVKLQKCNYTGLPIMCMEFCRKGSLRNQLNRIENCCGLTEIEVREILEDISKAVKYLHDQKITHRDIKPENIVLQTYDHRKSATIYKLIDLGYAKEITGTVSLVGTIQYLAPEIFYNKKYNHTVDYWSFGVTAFEIICGVRPFDVPQMTPFESFQHLKSKQQDDIFMYKREDGQLMFSTEILRENFISSCLKFNLEKWLRTMLEYDPSKRGSLFPSTLHDILNKKIITIFSVYSYEFYSYEINESTLLSTLQDWISRDIRVPKNELYLIPSNKKLIQVNSFAVEYYDEGEDPMLFVFKRDNKEKECSHKLPKYVRLLFEDVDNSHNSKILKLAISQGIYCVLKEIKHMESLKEAILNYFQILSQAYKDEEDLLNFAKEMLMILICRIDFCKALEKGLSKNCTETQNEHLRMNLLNYKHFLLKVKEIIHIYNKLKLRHFKRNEEVQDMQKTSNSIQKYVSCLYEIRTHCVTLQIDQSASNNIVKVLSDVIKIKEKVLKMPVLNKHIQKPIISTLRSVNDCIKSLSTEIEQIQINRIRIFQNYQQNGISAFPYLDGHINLNFSHLLKDNEDSRYRLNELITKGLHTYKSLLMEDKIMRYNGYVSF